MSTMRQAERTTTRTIEYFEDSLVIRVKTASPAALHYLMLKGIVSALTLKIQDEEHTGDDVDGLVALSNVLNNIIPSEKYLQKAFSPAA